MIENHVHEALKGLEVVITSTSPYNKGFKRAMIADSPCTTKRIPVIYSLYDDYYKEWELHIGHFKPENIRILKNYITKDDLIPR